jgi:hypothetical protein
MYLDALFDKDAHLAFDYSDLQVRFPSFSLPFLKLTLLSIQVDLYAEYNPAKLMDFLRASNYYSLERVRPFLPLYLTSFADCFFSQAYKVCDARDLVPEMVFLLGRMGDNKRALNLFIERLGDVQRVSSSVCFSRLSLLARVRDVEVNRMLTLSFLLSQAIEFAKEQNDNDLWEDLLRYSETKPRASSSSFLLMYPLLKLAPNRLHPRASRERRRRNRPNPPHPPHQKRPRDSRSQRSADQDPARLSASGASCCTLFFLPN